MARVLSWQISAYLVCPLHSTALQLLATEPREKDTCFGWDVVASCAVRPR